MCRHTIINVGGTVLRWNQVRSGTWSSTDEIVTKTRLRGRAREEVVVQKQYSWGDEERNVLVMNPWAAEYRAGLLDRVHSGAGDHA